MTRAVRPLLGVYSAHRNSEGSAQLVGAYVSLLVRARRCVVARRLQWLIQGVFEYFGVGRADASLLGLSRVADEWKSTHDSYLQWQQRSNSGGFAEVLGRSLTPSDFYKGPAKSRGMFGYNPRSPPLPVPRCGPDLPSAPAGSCATKCVRRSTCSTSTPAAH